MSLTSAIQNSSGATPAIKAVSGKAASPISASDISGLLNGSGDASAEVGKGEASATPRLYGPNNSLIRSKAAQNRQVTNALGTGVDNGVLGRTPRTPGPEGSGTPVDGRGSITSFDSIGGGAAGDGRGINGLANQFGLLPSLIGAQLQGAFGGPPPGFGNTSGQMPPLNFGDMGGASGSGKKKTNNEEIAQNSPPQRVPQKTPKGTSQNTRQLEDSQNDEDLLKNYRKLGLENETLTKDGKQTLENKFQQEISRTDQTKLNGSFNKWIEEMNKDTNENGKIDDDDRVKALENFREAIKKERLNPDEVLNKLLGDPETTVLPPAPRST